jgi:hypothetical protein
VVLSWDNLTTLAAGVGWADLIEAYAGWHRAVARMRAGHSRVSTALSWLGKIRFDDGGYPNLPAAGLDVPTFTDALNTAVAELMTGAAAEVHAAFAAELAAVDESA